MVRLISFRQSNHFVSAHSVFAIQNSPREKLRSESTSPAVRLVLLGEQRSFRCSRGEFLGLRRASTLSHVEDQTRYQCCPTCLMARPDPGS